MPISSHFQESSHVSSAIASTQTLSLPLSVGYFIVQIRGACKMLPEQQQHCISDS